MAKQSLLARAFKAGVRIFGGAGMASYSMIRTFLGDINVQKRVGRLYDNSVVAAGVFWYWRNLIYPRIGVERLTGGGEEEYIRLPRHGLRKAIEQGPYYDHTVLFAGTLLSLVVTGNSYWLKVKNDSGAISGYLWVPHNRMRPMADRMNPDGTKLITYYEYTPIGGAPQPVLPEDVVHFRFGIDPENPMLGLSPLCGALREVVGENEASTLSAALLINAGLVGIAISPKVVEKRPPAMTPSQLDEAKDRFRENTRGGGAGTPNFFDFPIDVVQFGHKPSELVLDKHQAIFVSRICAGLGLDPMILGLPSENKTYSNYGEALESAWENTLLPLLEIIGIQLTYQTLGDFPESEDGDRVFWDLSRVRALQPDLDKLFDRIGRAYASGWITRAEAKRLAIKGGIVLGVDDQRDDVYLHELTVGGVDAAADVAAKSRLRQDLAAKARRSREQFEALQAEVEDE